MESDEFREFYKFAFQFSREGTHRTIERDVASPLLQMVSQCSTVFISVYLLRKSFPSSRSSFLERGTHRTIERDVASPLEPMQYSVQLRISAQKIISWS